MPISQLITHRNLLLAWRRITTGRNIQYKRIFRPLYEAYEHGHGENLERLRQRLRGGWQNDCSVRVYLPKPSGLQRPLTILDLENQILLQAVANYFAVKLRKKRSRVEGSVVFSNLLSPSQDDIFFVQDWHATYKGFRRACAEHYRDNNRWIATFDFAAFYDTISHDLLIRTVAPRNGDDNLWQMVRSWLRCWSSVSGNHLYGHGLPQGPIASDFLAECFLLPLDQKLKRAGLKYVRYVDDIRLFADSALAVQRAAVILEIACRDLGLIPQGGKFRIIEARSVEEAIGDMPSIVDPNQTEAEELPSLSRLEAERSLRDSITGRPQRITDRTKARYVLYRAPRSIKIRNTVLRLIGRHPEHIDAVCNYLKLFPHDKVVIREIARLLRSGTPYHYVRGELWLLLSTGVHPVWRTVGGLGFKPHLT